MPTDLSAAPDPAIRRVSVRCHELAPRLGNLPANLRMIERAIIDAITDRVDLLVLPELATSGYYLETPHQAAECALTLDDPVLARWAAMLPASTTVVVGICEDLQGVLYNTAVTLGRDGILGVYRKTHLWDEELVVFTPGHEAPPVLATPVGRLGVLICYDLEFPELPRSLAVRDADIIAVPTNWPLVARPAGEHPPEVIQAMAAARSSRVAIACCDRRGVEAGNEWTRGTSIIGADGWLTGTRTTDDRVDATLDIDPRRSTIGPRNDALGDRRPHLY